MEKQYPTLSQNIIEIANSHSMFNRGNNLKRTYDAYIELIDKNTELTQCQKNDLAKKFHSLYSDYAMRDANILSVMVTGPARFPTSKNANNISYTRKAWEKVENFIKKYPFVFNSDNYYGKCIREKNNKREAIFQCDDYKIVEYELKTGEKRIGFHFVMKIKRQLQVALKSRGFRWNATAGLWGSTIENYDRHKEWCHNLSQNYNNYIK